MAGNQIDVRQATVKAVGVYIVAIGCGALLGACARAPVHAPVPPPDTAGAVAAIRALGAHYESSVQVHAVRDPAINGFLAAAQAGEMHGDHHAARAAVAQALKIAPRDPDLLQYAAELAIEAGDWKQAGMLAQRAYAAGAKVGGLCARNLETVARALAVQGDAVGADAAREKIPACRIAPVTRY